MTAALELRPGHADLVDDLGRACTLLLAVVDIASCGQIDDQLYDQAREQARDAVRRWRTERVERQ